MNAPTHTETRLTDALHARADLVRIDHLTPETAPTVIHVFRARLRPAAYAVSAVAAVAVIATAVVFSTDGEGQELPAAPPVATDSPAPKPTKEPTRPPSIPPAANEPSGALPQLFPEDNIREVRIGSSHTFSDGSTVALEGPADAGQSSVENGVAEIVLSRNGEELRGAIPGGWSPSLVTTEVRLGRAGVGYLVRQEGGDSDTRTLYFESGKALVPATVTGDVSFGSGFDADGSSLQMWLAEGGTAEAIGARMWLREYTGGTA